MTAQGYVLADDGNTSGGDITGTGTSGYISMFTADTTIGNSPLYSSGSSIALGTTSINASALFQMDSTTQGILIPRLTTAQKNAIGTPATGLLVYDTTLSDLSFYTGASWSSAIAGSFIQDGNAFGITATLGTTDNYGLNFITNNTTYLGITNTGAVNLFGGNGINSTLSVRQRSFSYTSIMDVYNYDGSKYLLRLNDNGVDTSTAVLGNGILNIDNYLNNIGIGVGASAFQRVRILQSSNVDFLSGIPSTGSGNINLAAASGEPYLYMQNSSALTTVNIMASGLSYLNGGNVGIGVSVPTAYIHLKAGTASANTAPLKFNSGTNLTTAEAGAMEYNGNNFYLTEASATRKTISGCLYTQTSSVTVANTVTETSVLTNTTTLPANFFVVGKTLKIKLTGFHSATANPTINVKIKLGSTVILTTGVYTTDNGTNSCYEINADITCRTTGVTGTIMGQGKAVYCDLNAVVYEMVNTTTTTIDTTSAQVLDITLTWGTASASNTITFTNGYIETAN